MGACCSCKRGSTKESVITLADLQEQARDLEDMAMEETRDDAVPQTLGASEVVESSQGEISTIRESPALGASEVIEVSQGEISTIRESPTLGASEVIEVSQGEISTIRESPTLRASEIIEVSQGETSTTRESPRNPGQDDELPCYRASNILWSTGSFSDPIPDGFYSVIPDKRLKLSKSIPTLDELRALGDEGVRADVILVDFENDRKVDMLKKWINKLVGGLNVTDPVRVIKKTAGLVVDFYKRPSKRRQTFEGDGFPKLGQIKHGLCRPRAILFKVLADTVGLESRLVLGFPSDPASVVDSYNHMSVVVVLNNGDMLVDLMQSPGRLIPLSTKTIDMVHNLSPGKHFCGSPSEPNSPMYDYMDQIDNGSLSRSEPNIATEFLRRSRGMVIREHRTTSSSYKSDGASKPETKRIRKSHSATPETIDDIVRTSRAIREPSKKSRNLTEQGDDDSSPHSPADRTGSPSLQNNKAISVPTSPQNNESQSSEKSEALHQNISDIWNEVLASPMFQNKPLLPYEEWNIDFSELKVGNCVGRGTFGRVFRGIWNGTDVAIKMFLEQDLTTENIKDFCNEISILSRLRHPNVILFLGACTKPPQLSLVTEYMEKGSLYRVLHSNSDKKDLTWRKKLKILRDICRGLMCIHRMGIVHRDLKSANCLLGKKWRVAICDFGLSRMMKGTTVKDVEPAGTPQWMAPEVIRNEPFSEKCDIFSFGVIMWELCTLSKPWEGVPQEKVIHTVANEGARLEIPEGPLCKLIADCWSEPEQRPNCEEILAHLSTCEYST